MLSVNFSPSNPFIIHFCGVLPSPFVQSICQRVSASPPLAEAYPQASAVHKSTVVSGTAIQLSFDLVQWPQVARADRAQSVHRIAHRCCVRPARVSVPRRDAGAGQGPPYVTNVIIPPNARALSHAYAPAPQPKCEGEGDIAAYLYRASVPARLIAQISRRHQTDRPHVANVRGKSKRPTGPSASLEYSSPRSQAIKFSRITTESGSKRRAWFWSKLQDRFYRKKKRAGTSSGPVPTPSLPRHL